MIVATGKAGAVRAALDQKPDVNARSVPNGYTPLHLNVCGLTDDEDRQEIIKLLHRAGADLEARTLDKGLTPLQQAALRNRPACISTLIECGANPHATEGNGATALHGAAFFGYLEVAKVLIAAGANPAMPDKHGNTPLSLAKAKGPAELYQFLQSHGSSEQDQTKLIRKSFVVNPPAGSSLLSVLQWQGRPITCKGKVIGRAATVDVKTDGTVIVVADIDCECSARNLSADFELRD
jgi:ankyrin repeat protein